VSDEIWTPTSMGEAGERSSFQPIGPDQYKALARELGVKVDSLLVLGRQADPFFSGTDAQRRDAEWFAELWDGTRNDRRHLRRVHYRLVSGSAEVRFPDGRVYRNMERDFARFGLASRHARHQGLVDPASFVDRRNPGLIEHAQRRLDEPSLSVGFEDVEFGSSPWELPELDGVLDVPRLWTPEPTVGGYDYEDGDQPVLLEVWIEKTTMDDALVPVCRRLGANLVRAAGFQSITAAGVDLLARAEEHGKPAHVLYISDFDPAGSHMPRAVAREVEFYRARDFPEVEVSVEHLALTREQVAEHGLPDVPLNPDDKRSVRFRKRYGDGPGRARRARGAGARGGR
jgi:hypothetical protein